MSLFGGSISQLTSRLIKLTKARLKKGDKTMWKHWEHCGNKFYTDSLVYKIQPSARPSVDGGQLGTLGHAVIRDPKAEKLLCLVDRALFVLHLY